LIHIEVKSTDIATVGYDEAQKVLEVKFRRGDKIYIYKNVPKVVYDGILKAPSAGAYFAAHVKGVYAFTTRPMEKVK